MAAAHIVDSSSFPREFPRARRLEDVFGSSSTSSDLFSSGETTWSRPSKSSSSASTSESVKQYSLYERNTFLSKISWIADPPPKAQELSVAVIAVPMCAPLVRSSAKWSLQLAPCMIKHIPNIYMASLLLTKVNSASCARARAIRHRIWRHPGRPCVWWIGASRSCPSLKRQIAMKL